jgi:hypothetical protein
MNGRQLLCFALGAIAVGSAAASVPGFSRLQAVFEPGSPNLLVSFQEEAITSGKRVLIEVTADAVATYRTANGESTKTVTMPVSLRIDCPVTTKQTASGVAVLTPPSLRDEGYRLVGVQYEHVQIEDKTNGLPEGLESAFSKTFSSSALKRTSLFAVRTRRSR